MRIYPFSPLLGANLCLSDSQRVIAFENAIRKTVKKGNVILDAGAGTGILSLLALKYGARKVYAIELDLYLSDRIRKIARQNGAGSQIEVINKDILKVNSIAQHIDVVLMEMLTTGLIEEAQVQAYNHLISKGIINQSTKMVPSSYETYATPLSYYFDEYGFHMPRAKHTTRGNLIKKLADTNQISTIEFEGTRKNSHVRSSVEYLINEEGNLNAIGLTSIARLSNGVSLGESTWINNSVVIPTDSDTYVRKNDKVKLDINYVMGNGFSSVYVRVAKY